MTLTRTSWLHTQARVLEVQKQLAELTKKVPTRPKEPIAEIKERLE